MFEQVDRKGGNRQYESDDRYTQRPELLAIFLVVTGKDCSQVWKVHCMSFIAYLQREQGDQNTVVLLVPVFEVQMVIEPAKQEFRLAAEPGCNSPYIDRDVRVILT